MVLCAVNTKEGSQEIDTRVNPFEGFEILN